MPAIQPAPSPELPPAPAVEPAPAIPLVELRQQLLQAPSAATARKAFAALSTSWGLAPKNVPATIPALQRLAAASGLELGFYSSDLKGLLLLGLPCVLELYLPGADQPRYLALTHRADEMLVTAPQLTEAPLSFENLTGLYTGRAYYLWKNHLGIDFLQASGQRGEGVLRAQQLLRGAGVYIDEPSGVYDDATIAAVTHFQSEQGLVQDGRIGPRTLALLYRTAGGFPQPDLADSRERQP